MKRNKGFVFVEFLIISCISIVFLTILYTLFGNISRHYDKSLKFDYVDSLYAANDFRTLLNDSFDNIDYNKFLENNKFFDLSNCSVFLNSRKCKTIVESLEIDKVILLETEISGNYEEVKTDFSIYNKDVIDYIFYLKGNNHLLDSDYMIVLKLKDGTFGYSNL